MRLIHLCILVSLLGCPVQGALVEGLVGDEPVVESFKTIKEIPCQVSLCKLSDNKISLYGRFYVEEIDQNKFEGIIMCLSRYDEHINLTIPIELITILSCLKWSDSIENSFVFYNLFWNRVNLIIAWFLEAIKQHIFADDLKNKSQSYLDSLISIRAKYKPLGARIFDTVSNHHCRTPESLDLEKALQVIIDCEAEVFEEREPQTTMSMPAAIKLPCISSKL